MREELPDGPARPEAVRFKGRNRSEKEITMKKLLSIVLALVMVLALVACGNTSTNNGGAANNGGGTTNNGGSSDTEQPGAGKTVGIAMPTQSSERWINDGANMKAQLEALGYEVVLQSWRPSATRWSCSTLRMTCRCRSPRSRTWWPRWWTAWLSPLLTPAL